LPARNASRSIRARRLQLQLVLRLGRRKRFGGLGIVQAGSFIVAAGLVLAGAEARIRSSRGSYTPWNNLPMPTGQVGTTAIPSSRSISSITVHRVLHLAVHLVDEVRIGVRAPATDLAGGGLRLDAVGRVNDHQRGIDGGQHAVGVFGRILVAGCRAG
jgi:hypothetical protein